ncbi:hypothetical protein H9P43_006092 [Blastocladiella emersonii ATCC 22665]|nr:hypothetical protein H9P43_006092 [Blastocladiella emersonii ATCC 22665]
MAALAAAHPQPRPHHHHHHHQHHHAGPPTHASTASSSSTTVSSNAHFVTQRESKLPLASGHFYGACRNIEDYVKGQKVGEGTYGVVYRVQDSQDASGRQYAVKRIRMDNDNDGFPIPSIREVTLLRQLKHRNVVHVKEVVVGDTLDKTFMLMEFCDRDLASLLDRLPEPLGEAEIQCLMRQLLEGMEYLHTHFVIHRDLKLANLLLTQQGVLKIADFGLARKFGLPPRPMTPKVVTLWYRAPELLLGERTYTVAVDNWSVGCIFGELALKKPLIPGKTEPEQLDHIFRLIGPPTDKAWPGWKKLPLADALAVPKDIKPTFYDRFRGLTDVALDLLKRFLSYDPARRMTCPDALHHDYFCGAATDEAPLLRNRHIMAQMDESTGQSRELANRAHEQKRRRLR